VCTFNIEAGVEARDKGAFMTHASLPGGALMSALNFYQLAVYRRSFSGCEDMYGSRIVHALDFTSFIDPFFDGPPMDNFRVLARAYLLTSRGKATRRLR
jgi:hypothetical protein